MSVATKNPFALLDPDDSSPPPTPAPDPVAIDPPSARGNQRSRGGPASRGGKYYPRGGALKSGPRDTDDPSAAVPDNQKRNPDGDGLRGRGRGRGDRRGGEGRGRGGGGTGGRGHGRTFDRHSQTGKTDSDKKVHQSWGGDDGATELKVEEAATVDAAAEGVTNDWATGDSGAPSADWAGDSTPAPADDPWAAPAEIVPPTAEGEKGEKGGEREGRRGRDREPEEEDNTLTLEQYLAQKKENEVIPKLEGARKANEGADDAIWKDTVPLKKPTEEDAYFVGKSKSTPKARTKKDDKVFLEIDARFDRPSRGGRGGRGGDRGGDRGDRGPRGGRGRGGPGRGRPNGSFPVNVDDEKAFPSLS